MKFLSIVFAAFALLFFYFSAGQTSAPIVDKSYLLHHFPICSISSSLGQRCKSLSQNEANFSSLKDLVKNNEPLFTKRNIIIETEDWYYVFSLDKQVNNKLTITFVDDAKFGGYFTSTTFFVSYSKKLENWFLIRERLNSIHGSQEDKTMAGKIRRFEPKIPFIIR